ncbi:MAG: DoxX family membrane protein [Bacteroidetes bacterium]|nr:DoxX family membrane protein [Bacteroidota bacterium]
MNKTVYFLLRLAIGASMFGHGLVRLQKLPAFTAHMVQSFEKSIIPPVLVSAFGYTLPVAEFVIGLLLLLGLFTRYALIAGIVVMILLVFGSTTVENWEVLTSQFVHIAFFAVLLQYLPDNNRALDGLLKTGK